jgi:hypothetical protein
MSVVDTGSSLPMQEVNSGAPAQGQFRVDYDSAGYYGTGVVHFSAGDNGLSVSVSYQGLGKSITAGRGESVSDASIGSDVILNGSVKSGGLNLLGFITSQAGTADTLSPTSVRLWTGSGSILDGLYTGSIAHGIANLVSSQLLIMSWAHMHNATTEAGSTTAVTPNLNGSNSVPKSIVIDDTHVTIERATATGSYATRAMIIYKG